MTANVQRVITSINEVPPGELLTRPGGSLPITDEWRQNMAVIALEEGSHLLLVADRHYGRPQMFEMIRRIKQARLANPRIGQATSEVIAMLYQQSVEEEVKFEGGASNIETLVAEMVEAAAATKASDIHIEARAKRALVYFRVNGRRQLWQEWSFETAFSVAQVLYVHADAASKDVSWNPDQVMDSAIEWTLADGRPYQLRFSSAPIYPAGSFHVVIRLLSMEAKGVQLEQLGYSDRQIQMLDVMITGASGIVLLCGPTNSGKSTTMQALMGRIYQRRGDTIKMITVEDPVEYVIPGACQISVGRKRKTVIDEHSGSAFTTFLRGTLRQDPDVVMVGEIRDHQSAAVVKDLVLAGRKILATLHTYSALWAYVRLREIGVPWEILTMPGFVAGIVYQRLVPLLCPHCSIPIVDGGDKRIPSEVLFRVQQVADLANDDVRVRGDGCAHCNNTGVVGRTVVAEMVLPDHNLLRLLNANDFIGAQKYWRDANVGGFDEGVTALAHGISKMRAGLLSPLDVEDQVGLLTADIVSADTMIASSELSLLAGG